MLSSIAFIAATASSLDVAVADTVAQPFQAYLSTRVSYDDNVFRLQDSTEGQQLLGIDELDDWYATLTAGFETVITGESQAFEVQADLFHQIYEDYNEFDNTGGRFLGTWKWKTSDATRGDVGVRYRRNLRNFSNTNVPLKDIVDQYTVFASLDKRLAQRWLLRIAPELTKFEFSASPLLDKQRFDLESELQYAASQNNSIGLLGTFTQSSFDQSQARDFSGWSIGPSIHWQYTPALNFSASVGYTHQGLDEFQPGEEDFDGITGYAVADFQSRESISWRLRLFRDISDLGGEIPRYTKRSGVSLIPTWQITEKLRGAAELTYERRDFVAFSGPASDRQDDFFVQKLWLDLRMARHWVVSTGIAGENRTSNVELQEFDDITVYVSIRFDF